MFRTFAKCVEYYEKGMITGSELMINFFHHYEDANVALLPPEIYKMILEREKEMPANDDIESWQRFRTFAIVCHRGPPEPEEEKDRRQREENEAHRQGWIGFRKYLMQCDGGASVPIPID